MSRRGNNCSTTAAPVGGRASRLHKGQENIYWPDTDKYNNKRIRDAILHSTCTHKIKWSESLCDIIPPIDSSLVAKRANPVTKKWIIGSRSVTQWKILNSSKKEMLVFWDFSIKFVCFFLSVYIYLFSNQNVSQLSCALLSDTPTVYDVLDVRFYIMSYIQTTLILCVSDQWKLSLCQCA